MVNKKYLLLAGVCSFLAAQPAYSQESGTQSAQWSSRDMTYRGESYDIMDSSFVPGSRLDQHRRYLNHQYAFPAKPRNMWEVGIGAGLYNILGDLPSSMPWTAHGASGGYGFHAHIRKSWGYVISTRLQYQYGLATGIDNKLADPEEVRNEAAWNGAVGPDYRQVTATGSSTTGVPVVRNYRMEAHHLNFDVMASINNIRFHRAKTSMSLYGFVGLGAMIYRSRVNATQPGGTGATGYAAYTEFDELTDPAFSGRDNRQNFRERASEILDDTWETDPQMDSDRRKLFGKPLQFAPSVGAGAQFRLSKRINLAIEDRLIVTSDDMLDGHRYTGASVTQGTDYINYLSVGLNFNLGNARTHVEPLYWLNPLDHAYNELSYPRHMMLPAPVLPDADGDGITDQFDRCPGTPAGIAVDSHGCPMDTDGDGVPDDRDKQLITPTECQPVDADGVGKCPCPDGCGTATAAACSNIGAGSITFDNNASRIRPASQSQLAMLAAQMQANPTCKVVIVGAGNASKAQQQRSWDRVNAIIEYMSEKHGIDRNRFIFQYGQAGDANGVMYRSAAAGEEGPANVAPPFPNLRRD